MQENVTLVQQGFRVFQSILSGYIGMEMQKRYRDKWWNIVLDDLSDQWDVKRVGTYDELVDSLDVANCLRLINREWSTLFVDKLSKNVKTWSTELMGVRNTVAHIGSQDLSQIDAERALDTMARVCDEIDKESAEEIREFYNQVRNSGEKESSNSTKPDTVSVGPTPIDIPGQTGVAPIHRDNKPLNLLSLVGTDVVQRTTLTRKVTYAGKTEAYPVYKVRLDALYYNDQNDRIATWITRYRSEHGSESLIKLDGEEYNSVIENFIYESNPDSIQKTQKNIALVGQREPGVALADGRIVDGNRRYTCLRRIQRNSVEPIYFETVIMDVDIQKDKKQIKILELAIQHGEEKKVDYDLIDYAIGTYTDVIKTKLLTIDEYAASTNEPIGEVKKRIECAEIICEFLNYLRLPEQFHIARELQVYSLFAEMMAPLRQLAGDERTTLKTIVFNNVLMHAIVDQKKFIRDIKNLIKNDSYSSYFDDQLELNKRLHIKYDVADIHTKADLDAFSLANEALSEEMELSFQRALLRSRKTQVLEKPIENVDKCNTLLEEIDTRLFAKIEEKEKQKLARQLAELSEVANKYTVLLTGNEIEAKINSEHVNTSVPQVREAGCQYKLATVNPNKPFVICTTSGNTIQRYFVSLQFKAIAIGDNMNAPSECKVFFVDDVGNVISEVRELSLHVGEEIATNVVLKPDSIGLKKSLLVIQDINGNSDEALQLIPFELDIQIGLRR